MFCCTDESFAVLRECLVLEKVKSGDSRNLEVEDLTMSVFHWGKTGGEEIGFSW